MTEFLVGVGLCLTGTVHAEVVHGTESGNASVGG